eukprot:TRINITY_DN403_c0_g1_i14.p1 TRINITY_DN403_c0_g1~~TRINITY_DN403_c0_g1_i14.p1  ORF type:complete len:396 (-),score=113.21 TRINITY_DN403_c0_g1_i14:145-1332(-)
MNAKLFDDIFNWQDDDSVLRMPVRVDSCPPTPHGIVDSEPEQLLLDFPDLSMESRVSDNCLSTFAPLEETEAKPAGLRLPKEATVSGKVKAKRGRKQNAGAKREDSMNMDSKDSIEEKDMSTEEKKAIRAEKNRRFAKESRDRKRKYVQDLEVQVKSLRKEVMSYKAKLKKYEILEKHNNSIGFELYDLIDEVHKEMQEKGQPLTNTKAYSETWKEACYQGLEEKRNALEMLTKEVVELLMPFPARVTMWISENNIDFYDPEKVVQILGSGITLAQAKEIVEYVQKLYPDKKKQNEVRLMTAASGKRIRGYLKELIMCEKKIEMELQRVRKFVEKNTNVCNDPFITNVFANFIAQLATKPEIRNYGITQLTEIDFGMDALTLGDNEGEVKSQNKY